MGVDETMVEFMRGSKGGSGGGPSPLEFAKLNIADITRNEKIIYFSYLCTSTIIRQGWTPPPRKKILDPRLEIHVPTFALIYYKLLKIYFLFQFGQRSISMWNHMERSQVQAGLMEHRPEY